MGRTNGSVVLDELERSRSIPPIGTIVEQTETGTDMASRSAADKTQVPNWVFPILATAFFCLLGFVYLTIEKHIEQATTAQQKQIDQMMDRERLQETWVRNTREQLIQHGWTIDPNTDQILAPQGKGKR